MIGYIKGQVDFVGDGYVLLDNGGIGYEIFVSSYTLSVAAKNPYIQLYTHLNVREDGITLYGFATKEEKYMFVNKQDESSQQLTEQNNKAAQTQSKGRDYLMDLLKK